MLDKKVTFHCVPPAGMSIILGVAEGEVFVNDAEIQKSALQVVTNCVCAPDQTLTSMGSFLHHPPQESVLTKMWNVVQANNGIKVGDLGVVTRVLCVGVCMRVSRGNGV